jgi:hypothetical protein
VTEPRDGTADRERRARRDRWRTPSRRRVNGAPAEAPVRQTGRLRLLANPPWQDLLSFVLSVVAVASVVAILLLLGRDILWRTIYIKPISVPKKLAEEGYGPDVGARRLQDAINKVLAPIDQTGQQPPSTPEARPTPVTRSASGSDVDVFANSKQRPDVSLPSDLPAIVIPGFGASLDSFAMSIQSFFGWAVV